MCWKERPDRFVVTLRSSQSLNFSVVMSFDHILGEHCICSVESYQTNNALAFCEFKNKPYMLYTYVLYFCVEFYISRHGLWHHFEDLTISYKVPHIRSPFGFHITSPPAFHQLHIQHVTQRHVCISHYFTSRT